MDDHDSDPGGVKRARALGLALSSLREEASREGLSEVALYLDLAMQALAERDPPATGAEVIDLTAFRSRGAP